MYSQDSDQKIFCRRPQEKKPRSNKHYKPCPNCRGLFSKLSMYRHFRRCSGTKKGTRDITVRSRRIEGNIHPSASKRLKEKIFPVLRDDEVTNHIRYDEAVILYGNWMCSKYRQRHLPKMIRNRLRLLGRFIAAIKNQNPSVKSLNDVLDPVHFDNVVSAINEVARLDELTGIYGAPSQAQSLGSMLKRIASKMITECIKKNNVYNKKLIEDFKSMIDYYYRKHYRIRKPEITQKAKKNYTASYGRYKNTKSVCNDEKKRI